MLERAVASTRNAGVDNLAFVRGDAVELPFRDASFDAVCCFAALHLFADPFKALDQHAPRADAGRADRAVHDLPRPLGARCALFESAGRQPERHADVRAATRSSTRSSDRGFADVRQRITGFTQFVGGRLPLACRDGRGAGFRLARPAPAPSITSRATRSRCQRASPNIDGVRSARASATDAGRAPT